MIIDVIPLLKKERRITVLLSAALLDNFISKYSILGYDVKLIGFPGLSFLNYSLPMKLLAKREPEQAMALSQTTTR